jgi:hypothetical protein
MAKYLAKVLVLVDANSEDEACDAISGLLSETAKFDGLIDEWAYAEVNGRHVGPRAVTLPSDWDAGEDDPNRLVAA